LAVQPAVFLGSLDERVLREQVVVQIDGLRPKLGPPRGLLARVTDDRFALCLTMADEAWSEKKNLRN